MTVAESAPWVALASLAAGLAVLLLVQARPRVVPALRRPSGTALPLALTAPLASGLLLVGADPATTALSVLAVAVALAARSMLAGRRRQQESLATSDHVLETCEQLASELASGQPPGAALERAADAWSPLTPVSAAFRMGADVPAAFRSVGTRPGAADLRLVAAAWQVAHRTGQGLADAVDRVARDLRAAHSTRRIVRGELASARATARLVAGLPVLALLMGSGAGGDPWGFLLGHPAGLACLASGLALGWAGLAWIEAIARDVDRAA